MGLFGRRKKDDMDVGRLLDKANAASPTSAPAATSSTSSTSASPGAGSGEGTFRLPVEDVFSIAGRGTVVTGRVEAGTVHVGMPVDLVRGGAVAASSTVTGVEMFRKRMDAAGAGDNVGLLLQGLAKDQVQHGDVLQG